MNLMKKGYVIFILSIFILSIFQGCTDLEMDYRQEMRDFVSDISTYAKDKHPSFIIIPQNGIELTTTNGEPDGNLSTVYLQSIDGVGQESLLYGHHEDNKATPNPEQEWLHSFLDTVEEKGIEVLVTDYCWTQSYMDDSYNKNNQREYISFAADHRELDNIPAYPIKPYNENENSINSLKDAKNFLYLIDPFSFPDKDSFIQSVSETNYDVVLIDFFYDEQLTSSDVNILKTKANGASRLVISYMSIGEAEDYRYYWQSEWNSNPPSWLDNEDPNWPGNYFVQYWNESWQNIIFGSDESYLDKIINTGFDGVYLDIIDAFEYFENKGLQLSNK